ncbi:tRNA isopentenyl-2-thiomethyl-A-37 hydroxylase MiaE [Bacillus pakistanensis]|uniref:tRNA isopentenyl-2-thiomethyl-A-37 hydroxylase MiaE n=1 Tax=Rossellomorea pakistanensis TaxID=992288 RepID=A0ABS2NAX3_9BACI|nr:hypothetical protein [Bacillus pakistanensis]MBM7584993.1 tRNA isopentenyl-2-thiomethyl-A-37 hydroxylase MiaE [Bacillus pakistanensis]
MTFVRIKELEAQVVQLQKELKAAKVDSLMMEKYIQEKGLIDDCVKMAENEILEVQADILRRHFKVVDQSE